MSTRRTNQTAATAQLDSSSLLSKLDKLSAQMEIAFPPSSSSSGKNANDDYLPKKSPIKQKPSSSLSFLNAPAIKILSLSAAQNRNENKENVSANEKPIIIDEKISEQTEAENVTKSPTKELNDSSNKSNSPIVYTSEQQQSTSVVNTTPTTSNTSTNKHLSAWKRTKILSKTLSSMEVIKVMKSKPATIAVQPLSSNATNQQSQQNLKLKNEENVLKKSSSGNLPTSSDNHHLNSPSNQTKRRSHEEVGSPGLITARLSSTSSIQTSTHNLSDTSKLNSQVLQAALNNLNQNTGAYQIPNNCNTNIINQLNKNYLKNIQKQKARSDWKSLKSKLIGLTRRDSDEETQIDQKNDNFEPANCAASQRNSNPPVDDGIICKKEDLLLLLRNSNLKNKQRRSNKPSLADVVVQLQENKAKDKANKDKNLQSVSNEISTKKIDSAPVHSKENNLNQSKTINQETSSAAKSKNATSNGRVQFVLSPSGSEQNTPTSSASAQKIKSSLKKTISTVSSPIDKEKNSLIRQTKSNTINNSNLNKKKVKIFETDQGGIRKALILQSVKDGNNNTENVANDENQSKSDNEDLEVNEELHKVKWDDSNIVDAGILGDAIQAFLSSITKNTSTNTPSFPPTTTSSKHQIGQTEKKVSFKK